MEKSSKCYCLWPLWWDWKNGTNAFGGTPRWWKCRKYPHRTWSLAKRSCGKCDHQPSGKQFSPVGLWGGKFSEDVFLFHIFLVKKRCKRGKYHKEIHLKSCGRTPRRDVSFTWVSGASERWKKMEVSNRWTVKKCGSRLFTVIVRAINCSLKDIFGSYII